MTRMKNLILLTILTAFGLQSCNVGTTGTWKDENIEQGLKNEIEALDRKVMEAVTTNNSDLLKSIMSDKLLGKSGDNIDQLIQQASSIITTTDYIILNQFEKVMTEINSKYKFPMTLDAIDSKPQILSIYPLGMAEGYFPMIEYLTNLDLKDTVQTKAEYENIHLEIVKSFKGIDKDKDYIFYKAFSQMPDGKTQVPTYGFIKELK